MSILCGWITDRTLYPLSSQGAFLRKVSALLTRNLRRISEEDWADVCTAVSVRGRATDLTGPQACPPLSQTCREQSVVAVNP